MTVRPAPSPRFAPAAAFLLGAVLLVQAAGVLRSNSSTYDEPGVIGAGVRYWDAGRTDMALRDYPPLAKYLAGAAARIPGPERTARESFVAADRYYAYGFEFLYRNSVEPERLLTAARLPSLALLLTVMVVAYLWAGRWYGPWGGALAAAAVVFEPNLLAHGCLATTDMPLTAFLFLAFYFLVRHGEGGRWGDLVAAGLAAGAAIAVKTPGLLFYAVAPFVLAAAGAPPRWNRKDLGRWAARGAILAAAAVLVLFVVYRGHPWDFYPRLLRASFGFGFDGAAKNYLAGEIRHGRFWTYYLLAFAVKTPLPFIGLAGLAAVYGRSRRRALLLGAPIVALVLLFTFAQKQNGLRYLLPAYPLLAVAIGGVAAAGPRARRIAAAGVLWMAIGTFRAMPYPLAYFNEAVGGPARGHRWLVDCNLDWGQDFPAIRALWEREGKPELLLATAGLADRAHYFGPQQDVTSDDNTPPWLYYQHVNSTAPTKEWLVVAASKLHGWGVSGDPFAWLRNRAPIAQPGHSSFVFDVTRDPESQFQLGLWYLNGTLYAPALRQFRRAAALDPGNPFPPLAEGDVLTLTGEAAAARRAYRRALALSAGRPDAAAAARRRLVNPRAPADRPKPSVRDNPASNGYNALSR